MDWSHLLVLLAVLLVAGALAYLYEAVNANDRLYRQRIAGACGVIAAALIAAGWGAGYWERIDLCGLAGLGFLAGAWYLRGDEDFRWICQVFGVTILGAWAYFSDATSLQKYAGIGLAVFCTVMVELTIRAWAVKSDSQGQFVAVIN